MLTSSVIGPWWRSAINLTLIVSLLAWLAGSAAAATLIVDSGGKLTGATGVNVNGTLYDVEFVESTCSAAYDGCDSFADFPFPLYQQQQDALAASTALLNQVFLDTAQGNFDSTPSLTFGCSVPSCRVLTPYGDIDVVGSDVLFGGALAAAAVNREPSMIPGVVDDAFLIDLGTNFPTYDPSQSLGDVLARWTLSGSAPGTGDPPTVPEPATLTLVGMGLAAARLARGHRRRKIGRGSAR